MTDVTQRLLSAMKQLLAGHANLYHMAFSDPARGIEANPDADIVRREAIEALTAYEASRAGPADDVVERVGKAICAEKCAYMGEPACWAFKEEVWPPPTCDEPGCIHEARAALSAMPRDEALEALRELLDEHDKAHGETKYTPAKQPPYSMTMDYLHRQTFAAMYAYVRNKLAQEPRK